MKPRFRKATPSHQQMGPSFGWVVLALFKTSKADQEHCENSRRLSSAEFHKTSPMCRRGEGRNRPTQSIVSVPLQVNRFQKSILFKFIVQYKNSKSCSGDFILQNLFLPSRVSCVLLCPSLLLLLLLCCILLLLVDLSHVMWGPSRHLGSLTAANWVSFNFNVSYSSC